jgi:hypothetical protein
VADTKGLKNQKAHKGKCFYILLACQKHIEFKQTDEAKHYTLSIIHVKTVIFVPKSKSVSFFLPEQVREFSSIFSDYCAERKRLQVIAAIAVIID